jgi:hypothetical protein
LNALHRGSRAIATGARLPVDWRNGSMQAALGIDVRPIGLGQMPAFQGVVGSCGLLQSGTRVAIAPDWRLVCSGVSGEGARYE